MVSIKTINQSDYNNIYIIGDIHGMFHLLEEYLSAIEFDKENDLLICCGDLVDRGVNSIQAKDYISYPWFESVMGNHDLKFTPLGDNPAIYPCPREEFDEQIDYHTISNFNSAFKNLPIAIEIEKCNGRKIVCLHAEMPLNYDRWGDFKKSLLLRNSSAINKCIWGRDISSLIKFDKIASDKNLNLLELVNSMKEHNIEFEDNYFLVTPNYQERIDFYKDKLQIKDLEAMFHGHSVLNDKGEYGKFANRFVIETGAFLNEPFVRQNGKMYIPLEYNNYGFTIFNVDNLDSPAITPNNFKKLL